MYFRAAVQGLFTGPAADPSLRDELKAREREEGEGALYRRLQEVDTEAASRIDRRDQRRIIRALEVYEITGRPISIQQKEWGDDLPRARIFGLRRDRQELRALVKRRVVTISPTYTVMTPLQVRKTVLSTMNS